MIVAVSVFTLLLGGVGAVNAPSADAALPSDCQFAWFLARTDGNYVYGKNTLTCTTARAMSVTSGVDRQATTGWTSLGSTTTGPRYDGVTWTNEFSANCNGSGTKTYRTTGQGHTSAGSGPTGHTRGVPLTC
jgi:hypothetical protein